MNALAQHRRFFLAPLWVGALLLLMVLAAAAAVYRSATTTTVIIVSHAESVLGSIADPPLAPEGEQRAEHLARMLGVIGGPGQIAAIYVSRARSAEQTAAALAARLRLQSRNLPDGVTSDAAASTLRGAARSRAVLVVTSASSIPELVHALSGIDVAPLRSDEPDAVYIISMPSLGPASLLRMRY